MDPGRYGLHQGWDNNSALEGYGAVHEPNFSVSGSYDERRFLAEKYSRDNAYPRNAYQRDTLERENFPPSTATGFWSQSMRRNYEDEYAYDRDSRRYQKPHNDTYHDVDDCHDHEIQDFNKFRDGHHGVDNFLDREFDRPSRFGERDRDDHTYDDYDYRTGTSHQTRESSREKDRDYGRHSYDSDYDRGGHRDGSWRRRESREREREKRCLSREKDKSPHRRHTRSRSRSRSRSCSHGHDDHPRSRSPRGRSYGRSYREDSYDGIRSERADKRRDHEDRHHHDAYSVAPSATVVVKGLSQKTTEEDLSQMLDEWRPLRHVRVIRERSSGVSRGFAFIDFPSVEAACAMMDRIGDGGLVIDGRKLFFEYSSKPTGSGGGSFSQDSAAKSGHSSYKGMAIPSDWICAICGCVNFARRTSCFQCNEPRTDDARAADLLNNSSLGRKGSESGPTHVLVIRGLDENADEEMLRYEFSKHAPIKDLRLVRDKFTHVSRGFAFVHFHSVEDATRALEATNGTTLEKNGQVLRVAYAKSILGPGSGTSGPPKASSLAAAAIEAATFAQQFDSVGWAPKEYNPDDKHSSNGQGLTGGALTAQQDGSGVQSGFIWDEASGYYYDAASGFYFDRNSGLYYDGNTGVWYSYDHQSQQYVPCTSHGDMQTPGKQAEVANAVDGSSNKKVIISAPAATVASAEKPTSLPDAVQAAASAAIAAEKKEKEKAKEIKLASKSSILANKKKMNNVLTMWKQRSHEGQVPRVTVDDSQTLSQDRLISVGQNTKGKVKTDINAATTSGVNTVISQATSTVGFESAVRSKPVSNSSGGALMGVIRGSVRGLNISSGLASGNTGVSGIATNATGTSLSTIRDIATVGTPFRTEASALGSYATPVPAGSGKRRFSETPISSTQKEQPQMTYRDRAAERRNLYGSSSSNGDELSEFEYGISNRDVAFKRLSSDPTPFPPGVGGGRAITSGGAESYEVITTDKAIDETNVGNRMLRSMGWHEGLGLGKDGSGMKEPVQAQAIDSRAGLGSQQKKLDPSLEVQAGDTYKTLIQKKALARFREMQ